MILPGKQPVTELTICHYHHLNGHVRAYQAAGGPSSGCEMIILRNNSHGGIIRVCMGIFTTALKNKKNTSNSQKKYLQACSQQVSRLQAL